MVIDQGTLGVRSGKDHHHRPQCLVSASGPACNVWASQQFIREEELVLDSGLVADDGLDSGSAADSIGQWLLYVGKGQGGTSSRHTMLRDWCRDLWGSILGVMQVLII